MKDEKRRVSTRLSNQDFLYTSAIAKANGESLSTYLKKKLLEPKYKMSNEQLEQLLKEFTKRVDILTLSRIEQGIFALLKNVQATGQFTDEDRSILLDVQHEMKQVKEGVEQLCRHSL
ncbi:hypothetical protein [Limosilactobacillus reuteri]|uniref:hypothetical protein n=1 Tax=Limosilactobacillus reuteri TaxID=1598 RepID=UPI003F209F93